VVCQRANGALPLHAAGPAADVKSRVRDRGGSETSAAGRRNIAFVYSPAVAWLTSLPAGVLVVGWLVVALLVAGVSRIAIRALVPAAERGDVPPIAAPLMPALGGVFAVLMALTLASEAGYLRSAQDIVSTEAENASRLAWAATGPGVQAAPIQTALLAYLQATRLHEWHGDDAAAGDDPTVADSISAMEHVVRAQAANSAIGSPTSSQLLASLDGVTTGRRARISAASRQIPVLYVTTLIISGVALIVNASALTVHASVRTSLLVAGLACVVGLSIALLFALTAPWRGSLAVSGHPIDTIVRDLQTGFFR
jgi:hypothetical protein